MASVSASVGSKSDAECRGPVEEAAAGHRCGCRRWRAVGARDKGHTPS
jgi:hypothetical protein